MVDFESTPLGPCFVFRMRYREFGIEVPLAKNRELLLEFI